MGTIKGAYSIVKQIIFRLLAAVLVLLTLAAVCLACSKAGTEGETTEEETTRRELAWEEYDPALDDSKVDLSAIHTVDPTTWVAVDGLGRVLPTNTETGNIRDDRTVACFYWTWHGTMASSNWAFNNQQNIDRLISLGYTEDDYWSMSIDELRALGVYTQVGPYHFWDEPVFGYYDGDDEWVIRKQAELLASAGVDVVFFDNTNDYITWLETAMKVMKVFSEARAQGVDAPCVSFMLPFSGSADAKKQVKELYANIYSQDYCKDVWYVLDGKPMLMGYSGCLSDYGETDKVLKDFFTWRANVAGYLDKETSVDQWGWLSVFPQAFYHNAAGEIEQMSVGVAVNHDYVRGVISGMSKPNVIGRTWTSRGIDARANALYYGACFSQQWEQALSVDPKIVFVTGWNEWIAMRIANWANRYQNIFVDQYKDEYSRDCEPSNGPMKDYYYTQLTSYIRRYKGTSAIEAASWEKLIDVNGGYGQWANVSPTYTDYVGLPDRDCDGYADPVTGNHLHYTNTTGRNDIYDCKVARDYDNVYFMVRTVEDLTPHTDPEWMHLYISTGDAEQNWENYEFVINKTTPEAEYAFLERFTGDGYATELVGKVRYKVTGNVLVIEVPKPMLGIDADLLDFTIDFKWTDNTGVDGSENAENEGNIMLWYSNGDCAPVSRFNYRYTTSGSAAHDGSEQVIGWSLMDFTSDEIKADFDEYILHAVSGANAELTGEGLTLTVTESGSDSKFDAAYTKGTTRFLTDTHKYIMITYKTSDVTKITVSASGGRVSRPTLARGAEFELIADGQEHTLVLDMSKVEAWEKGYITHVCIYFDSADPVGSVLNVRSIQLLRNAPECDNLRAPQGQ